MKHAILQSSDSRTSGTTQFCPRHRGDVRYTRSELDEARYIHMVPDSRTARSNGCPHPRDTGRHFAWLVGVNPPYRCDRYAGPPAGRLTARDLTGTVGVDAGWPREDDLPPAGMDSVPLLPAPPMFAASRLRSTGAGASPASLREGCTCLPYSPSRSAPPSGGAA